MTTQTTAVQVKFRESGVDDTVSYISAQLNNLKSSIDISLECDSAINFVDAKAYIDSYTATGTATLKAITLRRGNTEITKSATATITDNKPTYNFTVGSSYSVKIRASYKVAGVKKIHYSYFTYGDGINAEVDALTTDLPVYKFAYYEDIPIFSGDAAVTNSNDVAPGSSIEITASIVNNNAGDENEPHTVTVVFDKLDAVGVDVNDEQLASYSAELPYDPTGDYTLPNNTLSGGSYTVTVSALYSEGYTTSKTLAAPVVVLANPVIVDLVPYGIGINGTGAGVDSISTVMQVSIKTDSLSTNPAAENNEVVFYLSQDGVKMYSATLSIASSDDTTYNSEDVKKFTVNRTIPGDTADSEDLVQIWTTTPPTVNADGGFTFSVTAELSYVLGGSNVDKVSIALTGDFKNDVIPLASVTLVNAWIGAAVTTSGGIRSVDLTNAVSEDGYTESPDFAIAGMFLKNNYFGTEIDDGPFQDLDTTLTKYKFTISVNGGEEQAVQSLYLMQATAGNTSQQSFVALVSLSSSALRSSADGLYDNTVGVAGVQGSEQPGVLFLIPRGEGEDTLYNQSDAVVVSVQIVNEKATLPSATESNEVVVVKKVGKYIMTAGTDTEPESTGSGTTCVLTVPVDFPKTSSEEYYLKSVTFESNLAAPHDNIVTTIAAGETADGVFDILITNPSERGVGAVNAITYTVYATIDDPNGSSDISGPKSASYTISATDQPTAENFTISNYSYETFNNNGVGGGDSSFAFSVTFQDGETTEIDGISVYFVSNNDDSNASNDIPDTLVATVERSGFSNPIPVTLQSTPPSSNAVSGGVKISDLDGNLSSNEWLNYTSGTLKFRPYKTPKVISSDDAPVYSVGQDHEETIYNFPELDSVDPTSVSLTGGVLQSSDDTVLEWTHDLFSSDGVTVGYKLTVNGDDKSTDISDNSYTFDLGSFAAAYVVNLYVKATVDGEEYLSEAVVVTFNSVSVDTDSMTFDIKRGSNHDVLKLSFEDYTVDYATGGGSSDLVVTKVEVVHNGTASNENPEAEGVDLLEWNIEENSIQPSGTTNTYDISSYELGNVLNLQTRVEAGVKYSVDGGDSQDSAPLYLTLSQVLNTLPHEYRVATKPLANIASEYSVLSSGANAGKIELTVNIDAKGCHAEGLQGVVFLLSQEGNYTDAGDDSSDGIVGLIEFSSAQSLKSYDVEDDADATSGSIDNMAATEQFTLTDDDGKTYHLTLGNLTSSDASTLILDASFDTSKAVEVVVCCATRLGLAVDTETVQQEPPIRLASNNVTIQYTHAAGDVPTSAALFFEANPHGTGDEWFAVVKDGMKNAITNYANGLSGSSTLFTPPGQSEPVPFNNIVTTLMTDMSNMFANNTTFNQNIGAWDTSKVTNMSYVFAIAHMFNNGEDSSIGSWNTSQVTNMNNMFYNAIVFNQNLSGWNVALTLTRPSLTRYNFDDATPLDLPENSHKLPPFV